MSTSGSFALLYAFTTGSDGLSPQGAQPYGALVQGTNGNFYGTTTAGGANGDGTVFEITSSGSLTTLYSFTGGDNGASPYAGLVPGKDGNYYGTTIKGGADGAGTVYKITPAGSFTALYSFTGGKDGRSPYAPLLVQPNGNLLGTTEIAGGQGFGTVFRITPTGSLATLHGFASGDSFQVAIRAAVCIINSGDKTSAPGSFAVYVDPNAMLDGNQTPFSSSAFTSAGGQSIALPALAPGRSMIFTFYLEGSVVDTRLKLPIGFAPSGQTMIGVVTYSDPVADFDGSQKIISLQKF